MIDHTSCCTIIFIWTKKLWVGIALKKLKQNINNFQLITFLTKSFLLTFNKIFVLTILFCLFVIKLLLKWSEHDVVTYWLSCIIVNLLTALTIIPSPLYAILIHALALLFCRGQFQSTFFVVNKIVDFFPILFPLSLCVL